MRHTDSPDEKAANDEARQPACGIRGRQKFAEAVWNNRAGHAAERSRTGRPIQLLRRRNVATAAWLAVELEVSERTVYRDIRDLMLSGVPIEGEAGVGYILRRGFDLPPLMFTDTEIEAMVLGARVVTSWGDVSNTPHNALMPPRTSPRNSIRRKTRTNSNHGGAAFSRVRQSRKTTP